MKSQSKLTEQCEKLSAQDFKSNQAQIGKSQNILRKRLLTLLLPTVPAPRTVLTDETFPERPPVQSILKNADTAIVKALNQFAAGKQKEAVSHQRTSRKYLGELLSLVERWSVDLGLQTMGLNTVVAMSAERLEFIENYEAKVVALLELSLIHI